LATVKEPPTHALFSHANIHKKKLNSSSNSQPIFQPQMTFPIGNQYTSLPFYPSYQFYPQYIPFQQQNFLQPKMTPLLIPSLAEFLKEIDSKENTNNYYQNFLKEFEAQQISVYYLSKLTDEEYIQCGVNTIGARRTIREYAEKYKRSNIF
jgi:hypothetical protein